MIREKKHKYRNFVEVITMGVEDSNSAQEIKQKLRL
jgi:hypothetical protein